MKKTILLLVAAIASTGVFAEGYQVNNLSARQTGMGHVGTAMHLDSESIFFNPAATAFQTSKFDFSGGMTGIFSNVHYQPLPTVQSGYQPGETAISSNFATPIHVYANFKPTERLAIGIGLFTPDGSGVKWDDDWAGAHLVQEISLAAFSLQPTISYKICDNFSIGAGLDIAWGNFSLSRSMLTKDARLALMQGLGGMSANLPAEVQAQLPTISGYLQSTMDQSILSAELSGKSKIALGINAGFLWDVNEKWSIGMTWRSRMNMKVKKGKFEKKFDPQAEQILAGLASNPTVAQAVPSLAFLNNIDQFTFSAELPLPTSVTWGVSFRPTPKWQFAIDLQWVGWSAYDKLDMNLNEQPMQLSSVKNYSNTLAFRIGGEFHATRFLTARMGMYVDESPVSSNYLNPETPSMTKAAYTAGVTMRFSKHVAVDLGYTFVSTADPERTGQYPVYNAFSGDLESVFSGNYKLHANVMSAGIRLNF